MTSTKQKDRTTAGKNQRLYLFYYLMLFLGLGLCADGYLQAFMVEGGMSMDAIALYGVLFNIAGMAAYVVFPLLRPKRGSYLNLLKLTAVLTLLYPLGLSVLTFTGVGSPLTVAVIMGVGMVYSFLGAVRTSSEFSAVPSLFPRSVYGVLTGKGGMIGSAIALLVSLMGAYFLKESAKMDGYRLFFITATVILLVAGVVTLFYRECEKPAQESSSAIDLRTMLRTLASRRYAWILLPHFLRGLGAAGMYYFVIVGMSNLTLTAAQNTGLVTAVVCAKMLGNFFFMKAIDRVRSGKMIFIVNLICSVCMLLVTLRINVAIFFALYLVYQVCDIISQNAVPVGVMYCTPDEELPLISAVRMLAYNVANCLALPLFGMWMSNSLPLLVMAVGGAFFTAAGMLFSHQYRDELKEQ